MEDASGGPNVSVLGRGDRIEGTLALTGLIRIYGHFRGELLVDGEVSLSADSLLEANVRAQNITLGGRAKGSLTAPGGVSLAPQSQIEGDVSARSVAVSGLVKGNIVADDRVELSQGAGVDGDIACRILVVVEGASFSGHCIMGERSKQNK